jgi:superfamily II DNA or RNA helicase
MIQLYEHQKYSIDFCRSRDRVFDASDPGTGKTGVAIEMSTERRIRGGGKILVICPKSSIRSTWAEDIKKFAPYVRVSCAYAKNRHEAFWKDADVYITNHDAAKWLAKQPPDFFSKFDALISTLHHSAQKPW